MSEEWISVGRMVQLQFSDGSSLNGKILAMPDTDPTRPTDTGKYWIIQTYHKGKKDLICFVGTFNKMFVYPEPPKD